MKQKKIDSLVRVTVRFWRQGLVETQCNLESECFWGGEFDEFTRATDLEDERPQHVILAEQDKEISLIFTQPAVSFSFNWFGIGPDEDFDCGIAYMVDGVGVDWTFRDDFDYLMTVATAKMDEKRKDADYEQSLLYPDMVRFIVAYHYWAEKCYDGDYDEGLECLGVLDLNHLHFEGDDERERQRLPAGLRVGRKRRPKSRRYPPRGRISL